MKLILKLLLFHFLIIAKTRSLNHQNQLEFIYHNYEHLTNILKSYASNYPTKAYLYTIGKSVQKRELWVLALADSNPDKHILLRPEAKYIGNMHGNEASGREILLHLIDHMLKNQSLDPNIDYVMKNVRTHILVSMNPDGFEKSIEGDCSSITGRFNENNYDLNRNFPDLSQCNNYDIQPETQSLINWLDSNEFILSANLHSGTVLVNYGYDDIEYSTIDEDVFRVLALNYSFNHANMRHSPCGYTFKDGITNGGIKNLNQHLCSLFLKFKIVKFIFMCLQQYILCVHYYFML
jgi:carboxypeptidase M